MPAGCRASVGYPRRTVRIYRFVRRYANGNGSSTGPPVPDEVCVKLCAPARVCGRARVEVLESGETPITPATAAGEQRVMLAPPGPGRIGGRRTRRTAFLLALALGGAIGWTASGE